MQQLRSDIWCAAFVRRHNDLGNFCVVARRGDPVAGQVWIEVDHLNGSMSLYTPAPTAMLDEAPAHRVFQCRYERTDPQTVRERIAREIEFDQDLWVLSLESRSGEHGLDLLKA